MTRDQSIDSLVSGFPRHHLFISSRCCSIDTQPHSPKASAPVISEIVSLAQVCRYQWRHVTIRTLVRRSNVHLRDQNLKSVAQQVARCRGAPVRVYLHLHHWFPPPPENRTLIQNLTGAMSLIRPPKSGTKFDRPHRRLSRVPWLLHPRFPNLGELIWDDLCVGNSHLTTPHRRPWPRSDQNVSCRTWGLSPSRSLGWPINFAAGLQQASFR